MRGKTLHVWFNPVTLMERQQLRRRSHTGPKWPRIPKLVSFSHLVCHTNVCAFVTGFGRWSGDKENERETLHSQIVNQDSSFCAAVLPTSITTLAAALTLPSSDWKILTPVNLFNLYKIFLLVCFSSWTITKNRSKACDFTLFIPAVWYELYKPSGI